MAASGYTGNPPGSGGGGGGGAVDSVNGRTGAVVLSKTDVALANVDNTSDVAKPLSTAVSTALDAKANLASPTFTGTVTGVTKAMVGLANADNTADTAKPLSTAATSALAAKAPLASPAFTGTVTGVTAAMVGLGSVDNTSDSGKPVSTAQASALALKAPLASPTFTGTVAGVSKAMVGLGNVDNTADVSKPVSTAQAAAIALKADLASPTFTGTPAVPTATAGTNTTQAASTAFVTTAVAAVGGGGGGTAATFSRARITSGDITVPVDAAWAPVSGFTLALPAVTGDDVELSLNCMIDMTNGGTDFFDLVILVGGSIVRTSSSGTATGAVEGDPAMYPGSRFRGTSVTWSLTLASGDLSGGNVTFGLAHKGGAGAAKVFASATYPFRWNARNDH